MIHMTLNIRKCKDDYRVSFGKTLLRSYLIKEEAIMYFNMIEKARSYQGAGLNIEETLSSNRDKIKISRLISKSGIDDFLMDFFNIDLPTAHEITNDLTRYNIPADRTIAIEDFKNSKLMKELKKIERKNHAV